MPDLPRTFLPKSPLIGDLMFRRVSRVPRSQPLWSQPLWASLFFSVALLVLPTPTPLNAQSATGAIGMGWVHFSELTATLPGGFGFEVWGAVDIRDILRVGASFGQGDLTAKNDSVGVLCLEYLPFLRGCADEERTQHRRSIQDRVISLQVLSPFLFGGWRAAGGVAWHQTDNQAFRRGLESFGDEAVLGPINRTSSGLGVVGTIESQGFTFLPLLFQAQVHLIRVAIDQCVERAQWDVCGEWATPRFSLGIGIPIRPGMEE
jgi:hypothetical protein